MICNRCKYSLDKREFHIKQRICKRCHALRRYGFDSRREFDLLIKFQAGICPICFEGFEKRKCVVDHDHKTGAVRSALHDSCNLAVGYVENLGVPKGRINWYLSKDPVSFPQKSGIEYDSEVIGGNQKCKSCGIFYPIEKFYYVEKDNSRRKICNKCRTIIQVRKLDYSQYQFLMSLQDDCWICLDRTEERFIDHDYNHCYTRSSCEKCVRGVLCRKCNSFLGHCREDMDILSQLYLYVNKYGGQH